ncbi:MAG: hypothetical protein J7L11_04780 [Thermoprotei archaeon]|nr:hypothetical protein [Thermoprotei archaeon]
MSSSELLMEIRELKERLARVESLLRLLLERDVQEDEPLPDEVEAIESKEELVELEEIKERLCTKSNR